MSSSAPSSPTGSFTGSSSEPIMTDDGGTPDFTSDIVQFIHQESLQQKKQSDQVVIETYACTLWKGFFDMKHKLREVNELPIVLAVDMGIQLIDNLFWILYHYSSNLQLTLFLTERGRLLYTEFLYMSRTHQLMKELQTYPTIQDAFQFAIKKSIGSLTCKQHPTSMLLKHISSYRLMYRRMFQQINRKYLANSDEQPWTNDQLNMTLHNLNHGMSKAVHQHTKLFETCVYHPQSNHLTLTEFLLTLQLLAEVANMSNTLCMHGTSTSKNSVSIFCPEDILNQVYEFVYSHQQHIDASLDCLTKTHVVQHLWTIHRAHVLQTLSGEES
jgi:hypothetical protein